MATSRRVLVGDKVVYFRDLRMLNQQQLAEAAGLTKSTISRLESGYHKPHWETVRKLARALGVTPDELLEWQKSPSRQTNNLNTSYA